MTVPGIKSRHHFSGPRPQFIEVAPPVDATTVGAWRIAPNGCAYRRFHSDEFPVFDWLSVQTGVWQWQEENGHSPILRHLYIESAIGNVLLPDQALRLVSGLIAGAGYVGQRDELGGSAK